MTEELDLGARKEVLDAHGRCGICFYSDLEHMGSVECRRFPPAPYFEPTGGVSNIRARVGAYYWCGEFKAILEQQPTIGGDGCYCTHHPDDPAHGSGCYVAE